MKLGEGRAGQLTVHESPGTLIGIEASPSSCTTKGFPALNPPAPLVNPPCTSCLSWSQSIGQS